MSGCFESLRNYEEQFAHRFTVEDGEYREYVKRASNPPPTVDDWKGLDAGHSQGLYNIQMSWCPGSLHNYEEKFAHRFTIEDHGYQKYLKRPSNPPPIVEEWRGRGGGQMRGRDNRFQDNRPYRGRARGWSGPSYQWQNRHWNQGSGQQYHSHNQGYNSYNQRTYNNRY